jgi:hypothetical protein
MKNVLVCQLDFGHKIWGRCRFLSAGVNCVYYGLKSGIFVEVNVLLTAI